MIFIGYLTWWNGLKGYALDKSFRWDEWFWFGVVPALAPYLFHLFGRRKKKQIALITLKANLGCLFNLNKYIIYLYRLYLVSGLAFDKFKIKG